MDVKLLRRWRRGEALRSRRMSARVLVLVVVGCVCLFLCADALHAQLVPNLGGQRSGISSFQFLKIGVGARGVAMGESFVAVVNDASALFWNPAGLVQSPVNEAFFSHTEYVADIKHEYLGATYHFSETDAVGLALTSLHMTDMEITTETQPFGTGRYFSFGDVGIGVSYARKMTDQFSFGITLRYVEETLDILKMRSVMMDFGTYYWTGLGTTRFAVVITNFGADVAPSGTLAEPTGSSGNLYGPPVQSFQSFSLPTLFKIGFAMDPILTDEHRLTASIQLNHPNDNVEHGRFGVEYAWRNTFFLRGGIKRTIGQQLLGADETSEESFALGTGVRVVTGLTTVGADYAFVSYSRLGSVHRITVTMTY